MIKASRLMAFEQDQDGDFGRRAIHQALVKPRRADRMATALELAGEAIRRGQTDKSLALLELAWRLGLRNVGILDLLVKLLRQNDRGRDALDRIREGALALADQRDFEGFLAAAAMSYESLPPGVQPQDPLISDAGYKLFQSLAVPPHALSGQVPLRVGYVFWGDTVDACRLPYVFVRLAEAHDRRVVSPQFFSEWGEAEFANPAATRLRQTCEGLDIPLHLNARADQHPESLFARVIGLVEAIRQQRIDIVVFQSQTPLFLAAAAMRPAPLVLGFDHGSPAVYSSVALDACITSVDRFVIEHLCDTVPIDQRDNAFLPQRESERSAARREDLGLAQDACVVMTAGMPAKFSPSIRALPNYFRMVEEVMAEQPHVHWLVVGITEAQLRDAWPQMPPALENRVHALGIADGIDHLLPIADVYLDTFPISGGLSVFQAMVKGVATLTYRFMWNGLLDVHQEYSMVGDFLDGSAVVVSEPTVAALKERLLRLIVDSTYRSEIAAIGAMLIHSQADDARFARACERRYLDLIAQSLESPQA